MGDMEDLSTLSFMGIFGKPLYMWSSLSSLEFSSAIADIQIHSIVGWRMQAKTVRCQHYIQSELDTEVIKYESLITGLQTPFLVRHLSPRTAGLT